ncbi:class I SAM-dependent methyltransferase [Wukongibacter sp. M2B1]|uniref:class I SAM-dependent methyltransferase n=1 Tax=Wukongibacter sp. M2B1 TaxID=3088895 RepID=UPI003D7B359E
MKKTNYSNIADRYDKNKFRQDIKPDYDLEACINNCDREKIIVLDLACGTGIYLDRQTKFFQDKRVEWHGIDASKEMLNRAKTKVDNVLFKNGLAEELPYDSSYFDFISNNYAFHHFEKKPQALDEIARVIKKDGIFKMHNIAIHEMPKWWVYQFFPSAYHEDLKRFWQKELIFKELSERDFEVEIKLDYKMKETKISSLMNYAYNRDISAITIISDKAYEEGLERMEYNLKKNPNAVIINEYTDIFFIARKRV